jgi:hypothetical protein
MVVQSLYADQEELPGHGHLAMPEAVSLYYVY